MLSANPSILKPLALLITEYQDIKINSFFELGFLKRSDVIFSEGND